LFVACLAFLVLSIFGARPAAAVQYHGAQLHPLWGSSTISDFDRELDVLQAAGANVVRIDLSWSSLQLNGKDYYSPSYVAKADTFFQHAAARGIKVIPSFWSTPCWASSAPETLKQNCSGDWWNRGVTRYPPTYATDYANAARWAADRWGGYMAAFQIWNEPNEANQSFWKTTDPAGDYVGLVKAAYPAVKSSRFAQLPVIAGGLSKTDGVFTQSLYAKGIRGYFDAFAVHPYTEARSPYETRTGNERKWSFISGVPWIREIMLANGDDKPIWLTEFGHTTCNDFANKYCVTYDAQATQIADAWTILQGWSYVQGATQYNLRNKGTDPASREDNYGLLRRDFTPKPAMESFKRAMAAIRSTPPAQPVDAAPAVALTAPTAGATFRRGLQFSATASDDRGVAKVEFRIDGTLVATDTSAPYSVYWRAPRRLALGAHTVRARAVDRAGQTAESSVVVKRI
jgi:hypothetical protein